MQISQLLCTHVRFPAFSRRVKLEEIRNGLFACMTKRRISYVMSQRCCSYNRTDFEGRNSSFGQLGILFQEHFPSCFAQRSPHTGYFQTVRQSCMDESLLREREYLRFILKISKW